MPTVAQVNDFFRRAVLTNGVTSGKCVLTHAVHVLDPDVKMQILAKVRTFNTFTQDNDPYNEHELGSFEIADVGKVFWRVDIYADKTMQYGAENRIRGYRVLTIMLADDI